MKTYDLPICTGALLRLTADLVESAEITVTMQGDLANSDTAFATGELHVRQRSGELHKLLNEQDAGNLIMLMKTISRAIDDAANERSPLSDLPEGESAGRVVFEFATLGRENLTPKDKSVYLRCLGVQVFAGSRFAGYIYSRDHKEWLEVYDETLSSSHAFEIDSNEFKRKVDATARRLAFDVIQHAKSKR